MESEWIPFEGYGTARFAFEAQNSNHVPLLMKDRVQIVAFSDKGWMRGRSLMTGKAGVFPATHIQLDGETSETKGGPRTDLRNKLVNRLKVLDANKNDRPRDDDIDFEKWQEKNALGWLGDNKETGRVFEEESVYIFIDSAARDQNAWPRSGQFKVTLNEEVNNVIRAELIQASIPLIDKNVDTWNNLLRYSFSPHATVETVVIPIGAYLGTALALEIQTQMNTKWHSALFAGVNMMNFDTGFVVVTATGVREPTINQFRVLFNMSQRTMSFQIVGSTDIVVPGAEFALHVKSMPSITSISYNRLDDIYDVIGFERRLFVTNGSYSAVSDAYYITSVNGGTAFGPGSSIDARLSYSLHSNQAVDLRGNLAVMVDISPFNDNDFALVNDSGNGTQALQPYFAIILTRPAAFVAEASTDINNNSYPMHRYFREGKERVKDLSVALRRSDGSVIDFGNLNFFLTIRLTVKRTQQPKPMFAR